MSKLAKTNKKTASRSQKGFGVFRSLRGAFRNRRINVLLALLVATAVIVATQSHAAYSVQPGVATDFGWGASGKEVQQEVQLMKDAGVKWIRAQCSWDTVQKSAGGNYNWYCDSNIQIARDNNLNVLMNLMQSPGWAQSGYQNRDWPPSTDHYADWANYVSAAVSHFKTMGITHYEIWNEPNLGKFWKNAPSATDFTKLMQVSYKAAKAADPNAKIVVGGLAHNDFYYLTAMYNAGLKGNYDIMATHPYSGANPPDVGSVTDKNSFVSYKEVYRRMSAYGDGGKKIWFTEIGWADCTTHSWCVTQAKQADYLKRMYNYVNPDAATVPVIFWYNFRNNRWAGDANNWEDRLGLITTDYVQKPVYKMHKSLFTGATASVGTATPQPTQLHRYYNPTSGDHFYTVDRNDSALSGYGYRYEQVAAYVFRTHVAGTTPLCRYYNNTNKDHLYTVNCDSTNMARYGYSFERNEGYVFSSNLTGTTGFHRYWNTAAQDHFYTIDRNDSGLGAYGYTYEKVEGFACRDASGCSAALSAASK